MHDRDMELMLKYARELTYTELEKAAFDPRAAWYAAKSTVAGARAGIEKLKDVGARALKAFQVGGVNTPVGAVADAAVAEPRAAFKAVFEKTQKTQADAAAKQGEAALRTLRNEGKNRWQTAKRQGRQIVVRNNPFPKSNAEVMANKRDALKGKTYNLSGGKLLPQAQEPSFFDTGISDWKWKSGKPITYGDAAAAGAIGLTGVGAGAYLLSGNNQQKTASETAYGETALSAASRVWQGF